MMTDIEMHEKWVAEGGRERLTAYDHLTSKSIVWEIGGWLGEWAQQMSKKYDPWITVFEPVNLWYDKLVAMFNHDRKIRVLNYGLSDETRIARFGIDADASGIACNSPRFEQVRLRSVEETFNDLRFDSVDVTQINCEGGEYKILPQLISTNLIRRFNVLAIQFHYLDASSTAQRRVIQEHLSITHRQTECYDWKFEYWERK